MELSKFFADITSDIRNTLKQGVQNSGAVNDTAMEYHRMTYYLDIIQSEYAKPEQSRNYRVVKESWAVIADLGKRHHVFDKFQGQEKLRSALLDFLNGPF